MNEIWKDVVGYQGLYKVNNFGLVKSLISNKILKQAKSTNGYYFVNCYKNKAPKPKKIHRIVANAFLGYSSLQVNHKDFNKKNNNITNLEYVNNRENSHHYLKSIGFNHIGIHKIGKKFQVRIRLGSEKVYLKRYESLEDAIKIRDYSIKLFESNKLTIPEIQEKIKYYKNKLKNT